MASVRWNMSGAETVSPEEHAVLVAGDPDLAGRVHDLLVLGELDAAMRVVAEESSEIQAMCSYMPVTSAIGTNQSLIEAMASIDAVGSRSAERGDGVQAAWCRMLNHRLEGEQ